MKIGEVAARAGVTVKAVRHWEAEGLLPEVPRRGAYRRFGSDHLSRIRLVAHCREQGFSLPEVRQILCLLPEGPQPKARAQGNCSATESRGIPESGCPDPVAMKALVASRLSQVRARIRDLEEVAARLEATCDYLDQRVVDSPPRGDGSLEPEVNDGPHRHSDF
ncbi:MAG: MerR family transcriptional regulator [Myxococcales bacterium]|nr:MerR family transcriptional regulator [Myxococcales bacterium]